MSAWDFDKELASEFNDKYKIKVNEIKKNGMTLYQFDISDTDFDTKEILFTRDEDTGYYEPFIYNYYVDKEGKQRGSFITKGSCYYYWILVVRQLFGKYNQKKKKHELGSLYILQFLLSFRIIDNVLNNTGKTIQLLGTRQFGKTEFSVALDAFMTIFMPKFVEINNSKFWVIISSYSQNSVDELFAKYKTKVKQVAEIFAKEFPNDVLITGVEAKKYPPHNNLKDTDWKVEYGILVNDVCMPYSVCISVPAGTIRDGRAYAVYKSI